MSLVADEDAQQDRGIAGRRERKVVEQLGEFGCWIARAHGDEVEFSSGVIREFTASTMWMEDRMSSIKVSLDT